MKLLPIALLLASAATHADGTARVVILGHDDAITIDGIVQPGDPVYSTLYVMQSLQTHDSIFLDSMEDIQPSNWTTVWDGGSYDTRSCGLWSEASTNTIVFDCAPR